MAQGRGKPVDEESPPAYARICARGITEVGPVSRPQENRESISPAPAEKGSGPGAAGAQPALMGRENTRDSRTRKGARHSARIVCAARRRESACRCGGDKQEPGLPERAANGQAGAEPVSRRLAVLLVPAPGGGERVYGQPDRPQ